jgi:hypothetical protein
VNSRFGSGHLSFSLLPRIYTLHTEEYPAFMVAHLISGWEIVLILANRQRSRNNQNIIAGKISSLA